MIRKIDQEDIGRCVKLIKESFMTVADEFGFTKENAPGFTAFATTIERLEQQYHEQRPMYVYVAGNQIIGYYSLHLQENGACELNNLCVSPQYRHMKIGEKLFLHAIEQAKTYNCKVMHIEIVEENTKLRKWYESFGAKHIGTQQFDCFPFTCGYMKIVIAENTDVDCIFCKMIAKEASAHIVYESDTVIGLLDIEPIHEGHVLIVPKIHTDSVDNLPENVLLDIMKAAQRIVGVLKETYNSDGYSIMQNGGKFCDFGHVHFHVFPRYDKDGFGWIYPNGKSECSAEVAEKIRGKLDNTSI